MTGYLYSESFLEHQPAGMHPESPARLLAVDQAVRRHPLFSQLVLVKPRPATREELLRVHDGAYLDLAEEECRSGRAVLSTGDTDVSPQSYETAVLAAGGVLAAVDMVFSGAVDRVFCAVRPPGHHAGPGRGMGFCVLNNVALAARHAQVRHKAKRVLIADWDVHHGNGTQEVFYSDGSVLFFSTHLSPHYPGTGAPQELGEGEGRGFTINCPFPWGAGNREVIDAFREILLPAAREFKPEFTLISAGFDSRIHDALGGFTIDDEGFRELTEIMIEISRISGSGRLVSVLEGGYNLIGLAASACAHLEVLVGG